MNHKAAGPDLLALLMEEVRERLKDTSASRPPKWNWVETRTVALIHIDELSNKSPLGIFIELQCSRDKTARRLVPAPPDHIYSVLVTEYVSGSLWLYPHISDTSIPVSDQEFEDLRARFWDLLHDLENSTCASANPKGR